MNGATTAAVAPTGANVQANGIRQHYLRYGSSKPPLVLVPGITSPAITWGFVGERLAQSHDVYVIDVRGRGLSSTGPDLKYGLDALADDLLAFVATLGLVRPAVLGHSMGARIAIRAAARDAQRFSQLVLVDPPVSGPGRRLYPSKLPWYVDSIRQATAGMDGDAMRAFCPTWTPEQLALRAEWLHTCYEPAIVTAFNGFHEDDVHGDLSKITIPAGLMVAGRGGVIEKDDEEEMQRLLPALRIVRVENAGHMIPWDDFDGFTDAANFLLSSGQS